VRTHSKQADPAAIRAGGRGEAVNAIEIRDLVVKYRRGWRKSPSTAVDGLSLDVPRGAVVGFLVGLTSVGSGTLIIVSLAFLYPRLTPKELVGTDIFQAFMLLTAGVVGYISAGTINWPIVGLLLLGSLPGVVIGSRVSKYMPDRFMRPVLATVLVISGWKLI